MKEKKLYVVLIPHYVPDPNDPTEYVQQSERISHWWKGQRRGELDSAFPEPGTSTQESASDTVASQATAGEDECAAVETNKAVRAHVRGPVESDRRLPDGFD